MKNNLYVKLVNHLSVGAAIMSADGRTLFMNEQFRHSIGEKEDFIYNADLFSTEYLKKLSSSIYMRTLKESKEIRSSQLYVNENKQMYNIMLRDVPIMGKDNKIEAVLACAEYILPMGYVDDLSNILESNTASTFIFESERMREIVERINRIALLPTNVLLMGESGVGKDKMAEYIHSISGRQKEPFVTVNCAAIAENLMESELFGYSGGAFTGAGKNGKKGLIEEADGGTLFLDEINSLPLNLQGKLLRVIESKKLRRVGGTKETPVDFRLITASNRDLKQCVEKGTFREDLFYRINVFTEEIPALRDRREDILPLLNYFIENFSRKYNIHCRLSQRDIGAALNYYWPGNVRELRNFAEQIAVVGYSPILRMSTSAGTLKDNHATAALLESSNGTLKERMAFCERQIIEEALNSNKSKRGAADQLGIDPSVLSRKIKAYSLNM